MAILFDNGILRALFGETYNMIDTLPIDITLDETESHRYLIIDKPAEDGTVNTIGSVKQPVSYLFSGIFTDRDRTWDEKKAKLQEIADKQVPFTAALSLGVAESVIFESIDFSRTTQNKGGLFFTGALRKVRIISSQTIAVPANLRKNSKGVDTGKKQPQQQNTEQEAKTNRTLLKWGIDLITGD